MWKTKFQLKYIKKWQDSLEQAEATLMSPLVPIFTAFCKKPRKNAKI